jgi:ABC-type glycerol-3-phosphate transport system substrate-binding protein
MKKPLTLMMIVVLLASQTFHAFAESLIEPRYSEASKIWATQPDNVPEGFSVTLSAELLGLPLAQTPIALAYEQPSVTVENGQSVNWTIDVPEDGRYELSWDVANGIETLVNPEAALTIDGTYPVYELRRLIFPHTFIDTASTFKVDRYGNDMPIPLQRQSVWTKATLRDANFEQPFPLAIYLTKGTHTVSLTMTIGSITLGDFTLSSRQSLMTYAAYQALHGSASTQGTKIVLEAELPASRNSTSVMTGAQRNLNLSPYDSSTLRMNILSGDGWKQSGTSVTYSFTVPKAGLYHLNLFAQQGAKSNFTVYRKLLINGEVPFVEANAIPITYSTAYRNVIVGGEAPYGLYLNAGINTITLEATVSPYQSVIETIDAVLSDINTLSLEIRKLVGNQDNPYKEWVLSDYLPNLESRITALADRLESELTVMSTLGSGRSSEALSLRMAIENLRYLANDVDKIPNRMTRLSEGSGSAAQLLGTILPLLQETPLNLDRLVITSPDQDPTIKSVSWWDSFWEGVTQFIRSFTEDPYNSIGSDPDELEVWVNRPRQYVDLLQAMVDEQFTPDTGIKVKFSIMPNESKLVLANAANIQPDVALGVSTDKPYELAIRGALYDLRSFDDFDSYIDIFSPGALLSFIIGDSVYAIPETQDFWVTYYRKDIMNALGIPIPDTWDEVLAILPELQRYGMNFNTPLSAGSGMKGFLMTTPYLYNAGASLYNADGMTTALGSEAAITGIKFMAESFTIYGMPLTTSSFYNSFRYGDIPIGVSNFETYVKLMNAAPEILGQWEIALYPGTKQSDGSITRYTTGSAQTSIIFSKTDQPDESWEFLRWWMSTETQVAFQENLILRYGPQYLWGSANLEAFAVNSFPQAHKDVILAQWEWLQEPVKLPGSYMLEREISNVWNRIVFDGANPRVVIDRAVILVNREIARKMEEFGYLKDGVIIKPYDIPTIEKVKGWIQDGQND